MTTNTWLRTATAMLQEAGVETARLDCLVLLEDMLNTNRTQILANPNHKLTEAEVFKLAKLLERRCEHVPLAYLRGKTEFYGQEFTVNEHVLEPRPESESMIDLLKTIQPTPSIVVDVGTGSGALACTAKIELPESTVIGIDINPQCLSIATQNAEKLQVDVGFQAGNLVEDIKIPDGETTLLCNLPYVPNTYPINEAAKHEPALALFGGDDGLDLYRQLLIQTKRMPQITNIICESLLFQHKELVDIAHGAGFTLKQTSGLVQLFSTR